MISDERFIVAASRKQGKVYPRMFANMPFYSVEMFHRFVAFQRNQVQTSFAQQQSNPARQETVG